MVANGYVANPSIIANVGFCKCGALLRHGGLIVVVDVRRASSRVGTRPDGSLHGLAPVNRTFYDERPACLHVLACSSAISLYCLISPES